MWSPAAERLDADIAVVGAGPAGIAAAVVAAEHGRRVLVLDEGLRPGGQIWRHGGGEGAPRAPLPARRWLARLERSGARVLDGTTVVDGEPGWSLLAEREGRPLRVRAEALILATGARERFLPFPGWTLPGVLGVGGAQALLKSGLPVAGRRVVVAGSGPLLLPVAAALAGAGASLRVVAEQAPAHRVYGFAARLWRSPVRLALAARYRYGFLRTAYRPGCWVLRAEGDDAVGAAILTDGRRTWREACDLLCVGYGLVPATELPRLLGCDLTGGAVVVDENQRTAVEGVWCAGEPVGVAGVEAAVAEGQIAGLSAARAAVPAGLRRSRAEARSLAAVMDRAFLLRAELRRLPDAGTIVCRCEDVSLGEIEAGWGTRHAKLATRAGMGACQGRVCGAALQFLFGWEADRVRPPILPASVATLMEAGTEAAPPAGRNT
jgi:D-hydroxyproline dehydrogenase subunit alpha